MRSTEQTEKVKKVKKGKGSPYSITERRVPGITRFLAISLQVM